MSPRNLSGKYRCRPHPLWRTCACHFLWKTMRVNQTTPKLTSFAWRQRRRSRTVFQSSVYVANSRFQPKKASPSQLWVILCLNRSVCVSKLSHTWWRLSLCSRGSSPMFWGGDVMHRSCANFKCTVVDVNIGILIDSRAINAFLWIIINRIVKKFHIYIQSDKFLQQLFN